MNPALLLGVVKAGGIGLALFGWRTGRRRLLAKVNLFFAACVIWNGLVLLLA